MALSKLRRAQLLAGPYIRLLAQHEAAVGAIYESLAVLLPQSREFWAELAQEEKEHERQILAFGESLKETPGVFSRPVFSPAKISDSIGWACQIKRRFEDAGVSMQEALDTGLRIECHMIEANFFAILDEQDAGTQDLFKRLAKATRAHQARMEREASRLKWRLFGRKRSKPMAPSIAPPSPLDGKEDPTLSIRLSQGTVLGTVIAVEEAAADLYTAYAKYIPEEAALWEKMAADEEHHASSLHGLEALLERGDLFRNMGRFRVEEMQEMIERMNNAATKANSLKLTQARALTTALGIEKTIAETRFYEIVESDAPEYREVARRLTNLTRGHLRRLHDAVASGPKQDGIEEEGDAKDWDW